MSNNNTARKSLAAKVFGTGLVTAVLLSFGLFAATAQASSVSASPKGDYVSVQDSPTPTGTPRPIKLRPWVQFGHARPGDSANYRKLLFNHLPDSATVHLSGASAQGWDVAVDPAEATTLPGYANIISVTVSVPDNPAHRVDIERVRGALSSTEPYTTTAYLITVTRRHPFTDLDQTHWADDPVQYLVDSGVISGYGDGSFRPNENVTRAQFAKMIVTAMGWPVQTPATPTFSDVQPDSWAYGFVETTAARGVIGGYSDGTFRPGNNVTRAQVAKMVFTARSWTMESPIITNFNDVQQGDWAYTFVQAASSAEVMSGYGDHTFRPNAPATRAQVAKILAFALFSDPNN